jgi:2-iminobutanoate/2-iminopropanoate deaminase
MTPNPSVNRTACKLRLQAVRLRRTLGVTFRPTPHPQRSEVKIKMPREFIECSPFRPIGPYSHAVKSGNMVFVSGTPGVDPETGEMAGTTAYIQAAQAIRNVIACVVAAGGTEEDITAVQVNLVHVDDFTEMNRAYAEYFSEPFPARTVIGIAALPKPGARLTINAMAVLPST